MDLYTILVLIQHRFSSAHTWFYTVKNSCYKLSNYMLNYKNVYCTRYAKKSPEKRSPENGKKSPWKKFTWKKVPGKKILGKKIFGKRVSEKAFSGKGMPGKSTEESWTFFYTYTKLCEKRVRGSFFQREPFLPRLFFRDTLENTIDNIENYYVGIWNSCSLYSHTHIHVNQKIITNCYKIEKSSRVKKRGSERVLPRVMRLI